MPKKPLNLKTIRSVALAACVLVLTAGIGFWYGQHKVELDIKTLPPRLTVVNKTEMAINRKVDFSLFWQVWQELEMAYLKPAEIDYEKMVYGAISGMTAALGDPYTVFLAPSDNKQTKENLSGTFYGVGIQIGYKNRQLAVISPLKGLPAEKAGVRAGDYILNIRDQARGIDAATSEITIPEAVSYIRGERGTKVSLNLYREGRAEPFEVALMREEIIIPSVELVFEDEPGSEGSGRKIARLSLSQFGDRTKEEWDTAVESITAYRGTVAGIVLDLRNNPGGLLSGAVEFASDFISEGTVVVQQGRNQSETYKVRPGGRLVGIPVVVLVNEGSASASEILAGALRDRIGAKLVGTQTFGKGTVQEARDLVGGAGLHITTAEWILPSGAKINGLGLKPDVEVLQVEDEAGVDEQWEQAVLLAAEGNGS